MRTVEQADDADRYIGWVRNFFAALDLHSRGVYVNFTSDDAAEQSGDGSLAVGPHSDVKGTNPQPGRIMLNFSTSDVRGDFDRIKGLGADVVAEPYEPGGGGMVLSTFADPDGNYFQLSTPWEPQST